MDTQVLKKTYIWQFCANTECCLEDQPRAMADEWWESRESILLECPDDDSDITLPDGRLVG